ncbi:glycosyltransferase family 2 protein [Xinfangfangia pollutisoli]|uniref:glycosyltransferase family 2 protein n=1 Tax=Xinfangfangia pollutisoli TaxID=2865960 RepID=UPI001CD37DD2|nr:glycosyltransferase family 2 protein [Xinfangfangia pollutisoli]
MAGLATARSDDASDFPVKAAPAALTLPAAAPSWATVTTLREPPERVQAFVAQHVFLGASEIWLYFDDPEDPAIALVEPIPQVRVVRCTEAHKAVHSGKAGTHESRQKANAMQAYGLTRADWIIHLDADEMVQADLPMSTLLAGVSGDVLRLAPFEALHYRKAAENGRPDHYFHGALPRLRKGRVAAKALYGRFYKAIPQGMLSHTAGKHFVRTGLSGIEMRIHAPMQDGQRAQAEDTGAARLLHFHGGDWDHWRAHLERRLSSGAYIAKFQRGSGEEDNLFFALQALKDGEGEAGLRAFWEKVCTYGPDKRILRKHDALLRCNLWLADKIAAVFGGPNRLGALAIDPETGAFEADVTWDGLTLRVAPDLSYGECRIARGEPFQTADLQALRSLVKGRRVLMHDIGAGPGLQALQIAATAAAGTRIIAFEPDPAAGRRLQRNLARNGLRPIELRAYLPGLPAADADADAPPHPLADEMASPQGFGLSLMRIGKTGQEAAILASVLDPLRKAGHWPDLLLLDRSAERDGDLIARLTEAGYAGHIRTDETLFLKRNTKTKG